MVLALFQAAEEETTVGAAVVGVVEVAEAVAVAAVVGLRSFTARLHKNFIGVWRH